MRVRFAPSPTGNLHIGSVRTALFNWVYSKKEKTQLILRIEDTDLARSTPEFEANIFEGLAWLGLGMDEGPIEGGEYGPYRQSERLKAGLYTGYVDQLLDQKKAYYCFETEAELAAEKDAALQAGIAYQYSGQSLKLSEQEIKDKLDNGDEYTIRFRVPHDQSVVVKDMIRGDVSFDSDLLSDFIIVKSDGSPTYNFAVVCDDIDMAISHVIRGEDHLSNTPRQLLIYQALGKQGPTFAHLPIILGPDRSKLSKRHGAKSVSEYREDGFLADVLINYLSLLGWSHPDGRELLNKDELIQSFDISRVSKSGAVFDYEKLVWMNGQYIRRLSDHDLFEAVSPYISSEMMQTLSGYSHEQKIAMVVSVKDNLDLLTQIDHYLEVYAMGELAYDKALQEIDFSSENIEALRCFFNKMIGVSLLSNEFVMESLEAVVTETGFGKGKVFKPVRLAVSAMGSGPHLGTMMELLGADRVVSRLKKVLE